VSVSGDRVVWPANCVTTARRSQRGEILLVCAERSIMITKRQAELTAFTTQQTGET
jgi:hypothetical protein